MLWSSHFRSVKRNETGHRTIPYARHEAAYLIAHHRFSNEETRSKRNPQSLSGSGGFNAGRSVFGISRRLHPADQVQPCNSCWQKRGALRILSYLCKTFGCLVTRSSWRCKIIIHPFNYIRSDSFAICCWSITGRCCSGRRSKPHLISSRNAIGTKTVW